MTMLTPLISSRTSRAFLFRVIMKTAKTQDAEDAEDGKCRKTQTLAWLAAVGHLALLLPKCRQADRQAGRQAISLDGSGILHAQYTYTQ
jgi:hypothetical protein